jgi:hypothetical protein
MNSILEVRHPEVVAFHAKRAGGDRAAGRAGRLFKAPARATTMSYRRPMTAALASGRC